MVHSPCVSLTTDTENVPSTMGIYDEIAGPSGHANTSGETYCKGHARETPGLVAHYRSLDVAACSSLDFRRHQMSRTEFTGHAPVVHAPKSSCDIAAIR